ncbi:hypothetical protein S40285_03482 [Stachybotrys chlorohalonatus IBT 40285]|uniref:GH64 domain-containing protein n=1 Tax=Stachybotrys chlorohalonatus (strain IBT 40285) TaxID=1283841 RepID=A0A084QCL3_STAC4|nr:hypothetical protein S40285_03482 [Stachybotrys chlorohalonata IBT 40285]
MRSFVVIFILLVCSAALPSSSILPSQQNGYTIARPGGVDKVVVQDKNLLNGTFNPISHVVQPQKRAVPINLPLEFVNNFGGGPVYAYVSGLDDNNAIVFLGADGSLIYPSSGGSLEPVSIPQKLAIPLPAQGRTLNLVLPISLSSARIYFSEGPLTFFMVRMPEGWDGLVQPSLSNLEDPNAGLKWGFVELTCTRDRSVLANISYVDFVGMVLGMQLTSTDGTPVQQTYGLQPGAVADICNDLVAQTAADGQPWSSMCIANEQGNLVRILSPDDFNVVRPDTFTLYWQAYVDRVWRRFAGEPLIIDTQGVCGLVGCQVYGDLLYCTGDNRPYAKPSAQDIWGCDGGPFHLQGGDNAVHSAVIPRLCSAFVRSTFFQAGGHIQPNLDSRYYYLGATTHHYSRLVHKYLIDGKGYAFPYDDVNPTGNEDASGVVTSDAVDKLTIFVGGPPAY